jgi:hypothetical protein
MLAVGMASCGTGDGQTGRGDGTNGVTKRSASAKLQKECKEIRHMVDEKSRKAERRALAKGEGEAIDPATLTLKGCKPE